MEVRCCAVDISSDYVSCPPLRLSDDAGEVCEIAAGAGTASRTERCESESRIAAGNRKAGRKRLSERSRFRLRRARRAIRLQWRPVGLLAISRSLAFAGKRARGVLFERRTHCSRVP